MESLRRLGDLQGVNELFLYAKRIKISVNPLLCKQKEALPNEISSFPYINQFGSISTSF